MSYHWECSCGASGLVATALKTDASNADAKHQATCGGVVLTGTDPASLAAMVEKVGRR